MRWKKYPAAVPERKAKNAAVVLLVFDIYTTTTVSGFSSTFETSTKLFIYAKGFELFTTGIYIASACRGES